MWEKPIVKNPDICIGVKHWLSLTADAVNNDVGNIEDCFTHATQSATQSATSLWSCRAQFCVQKDINAWVAWKMWCYFRQLQLSDLIKNFS